VRAPIHPGDDPRERLTRIVDAQQAVHCTRKPDRRDFAAAHAQVGEHARECVHGSAIDDARVLLDEVRLGRFEAVGL